MALKFKPVIELGDLPKDTVINFTIDGESTYNETITVVSRGGCGCTTLEPVVVKPNGKFKIEGTITKRSTLGKSSKYVYAKREQDDKSTEVTIRLNYNIV